ncbi:hypothetical protein [Streptomyces sp. NPDC002851]
MAHQSSNERSGATGRYTVATICGVLALGGLVAVAVVCLVMLPNGTDFVIDRLVKEGRLLIPGAGITFLTLAWLFLRRR